eukprot:4415573-Pleurochrysis_carterae.AAC.1
MYAVIGQELGELARGELAGVVAVERTHDAGRSCGTFVRVCRESGDEASDMSGCFRFVTHEMDGLKPCVVIHKY